MRPTSFCAILTNPQARRMVRVGFLMLILVGFFLSFERNAFRIVSPDVFTKFHADSATLVMGKLLKLDEGRGIFEDAFLIKNRALFSGNPENYVSEESFPYRSQFGLQGLVYSLIHRIGNQEAKSTYALTESLTALGAAVLCTLFTSIVLFRFGWVGGVLVFLTMFFNVDLVLLSRNPYWVSFLLFVPMVLVCGLYPAVQLRPALWPILVVGVFVAALIKFLCGYEFITNVVLSTVPVVFFHGFLAGKSWRKIAGDSLLLIGASALAFLVAISIHCSWLARAERTTVNEAMAFVVNRAEHNTFHSTTRKEEEFARKYKPIISGGGLFSVKLGSQKAIHLGIWSKNNSEPYYLLSLTYLGYAALVALALIYFSIKRNLLRGSLSAGRIALFWGFTMALLGSLSWVFAARGHCLDIFLGVNIVLVCPFLLFCGYMLAYLLRRAPD